jgi:hypothetical protein
MEKVRKYLFKTICLFAAIVILANEFTPIAIKLYNKTKSVENTFYGFYNKPETPDFSLKSLVKGLWNGTFQTQFGLYFADQLPFRITMTNIYSQIIYSVFNSTDFYIQIGKENYLIEPGYPQALLKELNSKEKKELEGKIDIMLELEKALERINKPCIVIITPSKASIYPDKLPSCYQPYINMKLNGEYGQNGYEYFTEYANKTGLKYFDKHDMFDTMRLRGEDVFVQGGAHWTGLAVVPYYNLLSKELSALSPKAIGSVTVDKTEKLYKNPFLDDGDLPTRLNLFEHPFNFYSTHIKISTKDTEFQPDIFIVGGSFNWIWLNMSCGSGWEKTGNNIFGRMLVSWYNSYILELPENTLYRDTTTDYQDILNNDIIILEMNEQQCQVSPSYNFASNLLNYLKENGITEGEVK